MGVSTTLMTNMRTSWFNVERYIFHFARHDMCEFGEMRYLWYLKRDISWAAVKVSYTLLHQSAHRAGKWSNDEQQIFVNCTILLMDLKGNCCLKQGTRVLSLLFGSLKLCQKHYMVLLQGRNRILEIRSGPIPLHRIYGISSF